MENISRENSKFWSSFICELTEEINSVNVLTPFIQNVSLTKKREEGHSNAQAYCDFLIEKVFPNLKTLQKFGFEVLESTTEREHGDFYLYNKIKDLKIRCNGKLGVSKKLGQPNMCSIERAVDYLHKSNLPYLVFKLRKLNGDFKFHIFDLYNVIDVITYNDGPGQLMISESKFYKKNEFKYLKTSEVMIYLCDIQEIAYQNLIKSRNARLNKFKEIKKNYE